MYTVNPQEAQAVERHIKRIFESPSVQARAEAVGRLFVEELDFHPAARSIPLANARGRACPFPRTLSMLPHWTLPMSSMSPWISGESTGCARRKQPKRPS